MYSKFIVTFSLLLSFYSSITVAQMVAGTTTTSQITCDDPDIIDQVNSVLLKVENGETPTNEERVSVINWISSCCTSSTPDPNTNVGKLCIRITELRRASNTVKTQGQTSSNDQTNNNSSGLSDSQLQAFQTLRNSGVIDRLNSSSESSSNSSGNTTQGNDNQSIYNLAASFSSTNSCDNVQYVSDPANFKICCNEANENRNVEVCSAVICMQSTESNLSTNPQIFAFCCNPQASFATAMSKKCNGAYPPQFCTQLSVEQLSASAQASQNTSVAASTSAQSTYSIYNLCCTGAAYKLNKKKCDLVNVTEEEEEEVDYCIDPNNRDAENEKTKAKYFERCCQKLSPNTPKLQKARCDLASQDPCVDDKTFIDKLFRAGPEFYFRECCVPLDREDPNFSAKERYCNKAKGAMREEESEPEAPTTERKDPPKTEVIISAPTTTINVEKSVGIQGFKPQMCFDAKFRKVTEPVKYHKACCAGLVAKKLWKKKPEGPKLRSHCKLINKQIFEGNKDFKSNQLKKKCSDDKMFNTSDPATYYENCCGKKIKKKMSGVGEFCLEAKNLLNTKQDTERCEGGGLDFLLADSQNFERCCNESIMISDCQKAKKIKKCLNPKFLDKNFKSCCIKVKHDNLANLCKENEMQKKKEKEEAIKKAEEEAKKKAEEEAKIKAEEEAEENAKKEAAVAKEAAFIKQCHKTNFAAKNFEKCCHNNLTKKVPSLIKLCRKLKKEIGAKNS